MKIVVEQLTDWKEAQKDALVTVKKLPLENGNLSTNWKLSVLYAEHSPIRSCLYRIAITDIKSWVATHLVRHHVGVQSFVSTQRPDRTDANIDRDSLKQGNLVNMNILLNAQAFINISRKRLCASASVETKEVWQSILNELNKVDPELRSVCVRECIYRGFCPERTSCGYSKTENFLQLTLKYRSKCESGKEPIKKTDEKVEQKKQVFKKKKPNYTFKKNQRDNQNQENIKPIVIPS